MSLVLNSTTDHTSEGLEDIINLGVPWYDKVPDGTASVVPTVETVGISAWGGG